MAIHQKPIAAAILETSASAFSAFAANRLLDECPEIKAGFGDAAFRDWKDHFQQRVRELAIAIAEGEKKLFTDRIAWTTAAFRARTVPTSWLSQSLVCLRDVLCDELSESNRALPCEYIDAAIECLQSSPETPPANAGLSELTLEFLESTLRGDSEEAIRAVVTAVDDGLPVKQAYVDVLLASQIEVGRMWHAAEISVSEEHLVTATTQRAMAILGYHAEKKPPNGLTVVAAGVSGNVHDIGIRAISDFFQFEGWRAICLGGDTPATESAFAVKCFEASLLLVSAALTTQINSVRKTIDAVRALDGVDCKIMVGGMAFGGTPDLWQQLGADGYAPTLDDAVIKGTHLVVS